MSFVKSVIQFIESCGDPGSFSLATRALFSLRHSAKFRSEMRVFCVTRRLFHIREGRREEFLQGWLWVTKQTPVSAKVHLIIRARGKSHNENSEAVCWEKEVSQTPYKECRMAAFKEPQPKQTEGV